MCGIAGIYKLNDEALEKQTLVRFTDSMSHRGPDGAGYELFENNTFGLGQRRLSILDLSELGRQPMSYADGRYWITYNGEIFNFEEIKKELLTLGYHFKSSTDTEVILAAYTQWGKDCLTKFNGMWAFAIWDNQSKELFLARDRFGIKPLYYVFIPNNFFAFASETRAFKFLDGYQRSFDDELLQLNIANPYSLEGLGYTPFNGIVQLLPSHYTIVKKDTKHIQQKRWWNIHDYTQTEIPKTLEEQAEKFYELFKDACRIRLISDVPVATALSGGLDSTSVYSTVYDILKHESLERTNPDNQRAFTAIFPGIPNDEKEYADRAVNFVGGKINYIETDYGNLAQQIEKDTELSDLISSNPITAISAIYAGMKKNGITVSMDGHGVDEMMYGYRDMIYSLYNHALWHGETGNARRYQSVLAEMYHHNERTKVVTHFDKNAEEKIAREKTFFFKAKKMLGRVKLNAGEFMPVNLPPLSDKPYNFSNLKLEDRMLYHQFFMHTLPSLLRNFDRAGMMNSIEIRMPFMDWRLVSYLFSLPETSKLGNGFTKLILREAMKGRMDEGIRTRTFKVGIASPLNYWFNNSLKEWMFDKVNSPSFINSFIGADKLRKELNSCEGIVSENLSKEIWRNINIGLIK